MSLPTLTVTLRCPDPEYVPKYSGDDCRPYNADEYYAEFEVEVEVVQLNLNSGGMRVRYQWPSKQTKSGFETVSRDIPLQHFYDAYEITPR